jgi:hypothetical protein
MVIDLVIDLATGERIASRQCAHRFASQQEWQTYDEVDDVDSTDGCSDSGIATSNQFHWQIGNTRAWRSHKVGSDGSNHRHFELLVFIG